MSNPWLDIPLADYEGHMASPSVDQAKMVADVFEAVLTVHSPATAAVVGCAGGNGFDRARKAGVTRLVGLDINPGFIAGAERRHRGEMAGLELHCADLQGDWPSIPPVDVVYAALVLEFVDLAPALGNIATICRPGGVLAALLQMPHDAIATVSPSPFPRIGEVASIFRFIPPAELHRVAEAVGFAFASAETIPHPSGKSFSLQVFRRQPDPGGARRSETTRMEHNGNLVL